MDEYEILMYLGSLYEYKPFNEVLRSLMLNHLYCNLILNASVFPKMFEN